MVRHVRPKADKFLVEHRRGVDSFVVEVSADSPEEAARRVASLDPRFPLPGIVSRLPSAFRLYDRLFGH